MIVAERRKEKGLSQKDLAEEIGVSRGRVGQWEAGVDHIPEHHLQTIARILEMDVAEIVGASRPIRGESDHREWRQMVWKDHSLDGTVQTILMFLTEMLVKPDEVRFSGTQQRIAENINSLTLQDVQDAWPALLESGYVRRETDAEWVLLLVFPGQS